MTIKLLQCSKRRLNPVNYSGEARNRFDFEKKIKEAIIQMA
jgi:hypothetical protein